MFNPPFAFRSPWCCIITARDSYIYNRSGHRCIQGGDVMGRKPHAGATRSKRDGWPFCGKGRGKQHKVRCCLSLLCHWPELLETKIDLWVGPNKPRPLVSKVGPLRKVPGVFRKTFKFQLQKKIMMECVKILLLIEAKDSGSRLIYGSLMLRQHSGSFGPT